MMPGGTGVELASRVRACQTGVPLILVSSDPDAGGAAIAAPSAFLRKPFSLRDLTVIASSLLEVSVPSVQADSPGDIAARLRGRAAAPSTDPARPVGWT